MPTGNQLNGVSRRSRGSFPSPFLFLAHTLIPAALLVFGAPFIGLLFYATMNLDDFAKADLTGQCVWHARLTVTGMAWSVYTSSTGRWVTALLQSLLMSKLDLSTYYGWLLLLVVLTNIAALSYFFASFLHVPATRALLAGGAFYAAWLASVPSPGENVFWLTGATEYQLPISSLLIMAALLCKPKHTTFSYISLAVLAIAIPGLHEIAGAFLLVCLLVGVVATRLLNLPARQWLLSLGLASISFAAIMLSPGKTQEFAYDKPSWGLVHILPYAKSALSYGIGWVLNPAVLLCAFCLPALLWTGHDSSIEPEFLPPRWLAWAALGAMGALLIEFAGAGISISRSYGQVPPRAVGWFEFVFSLLLVCVIVTGMPEIARMRLSSRSRVAVLTLFALSLVGSRNFRLAEKDLRGPARPYWRSGIARLKQHGVHLQFEPLPPKPALFRETMLSPDPTCPANRCMAVYLGASTATVKSPGESPLYLQHPWGCDLEP